MAEIADLENVDASNTARFPEGQAPSTVNNGARALEGLVSRWHNTINGSVATTGAADTYVWACPQTLSAYYDGLIICVDINATCTGASTINVDSLGAKTIKKLNDQDVAAGDLEAGGKYILVYDGTNFQLMSSIANAPGTLSNVVEDTTPQLGGDLDLNGNNIDFPTTPNVADCLDEDNMASDSAVSLATQQSIKAYVDTEVAAVVTGKLLQRVVTENVTYSNDSGANIPIDDTIPQNTEGAELMTRAITPASATNRLLITAQLAIMNNNGFGFALFQDTTANALAGHIGITTSGVPVQAMLFHEMAAGTTSATTFKIRFGETAGGTTYINGNAGSRLLGGVMKTYLMVEEYET